MAAGILDQKVAVVTGAGRGIGRAIAVGLAAEGASVVVNDIGAALDGQGTDLGPAEETAEFIRKQGGKAVASADSVADWDGAHRIIQTALDTWGRVDCVVNNAGIVRDGIFYRMSEEDWDAAIGVMLKGTFNVSRAAAPHFRSQESGAFVHITSTSGLIGNVGQSNYMAAKLGIVALSKGIALDMKRFGVRSNCVAPQGFTRMNASVPEVTEEQKIRAARRKQVTAEHNVPLVACLLSDRAKHVSGQVFAVRKNEVFLMSQSRPLRSVQRNEGWTSSTIAEHALPALGASFYPLDTIIDVFNWDPV